MVKEIMNKYPQVINYSQEGNIITVLLSDRMIGCQVAERIEKELSYQFKIIRTYED